MVFATHLVIWYKELTKEAYKQLNDITSIDEDLSTTKLQEFF